MLRRERLDLGERALEVAVRFDDAADGVRPVLRLGGELELGDARVGAVPASTTTSEGPAGRSIATSRETRSFASFTNAFPGPTILSTRGIDSVPKAKAAIAGGPPSAHTSSIPSSRAAAATAPAPAGGVATTIRSTPATCAGTAHMTSVETRPRGT